MAMRTLKSVTLFAPESDREYIADGNTEIKVFSKDHQVLIRERGENGVVTELRFDNLPFVVEYEERSDA